MASDHNGEAHTLQELQVSRMGIEERVAHSSIMQLQKQQRSERPSVTLEWKNVSYSVMSGDKMKKKEKCILENVSGRALPGKLIAIMGPSGAGKTTLLNVLSGRVVSSKGARLNGQILLNGIDVNSIGSRFARMAAFVQQDDVLLSLQTVRETLTSAARFRLPKEMRISDKIDRIDSIISELGLRKAEHTHIGDASHRGISGGERKRCNIGVELIQDPSLLFLDEPTSGLDSFQALNVIETLCVLCKSGTTVVLSIHQPRSSIFALFDDLIVLSEGRVIYDGKAGKESVSYFADLGFICPDLFNPADYFLDIVSVDNRSLIEESKSNSRIALLIAAQLQSKIQKKQFANSQETTVQLFDLKNNKNKENSVRSSFFEQICILSARNARQIGRDKTALFLRMFMTVFFASFLSALYSSTDRSQTGIQDRQGILFFVTINQAFSALFNVVNVFVLEKAIVMRERQSKSYHLSAYYLTKVGTALPLDGFVPCIFATIVYWSVGLNDDPTSYLSFLLIVVIVTLNACGLGMFIGAIAKSVESANAMAPVFMIVSILFGGFYINADNIPIWIQWIKYISFIHWGFAAFAINEFRDTHFKCNTTDDQDGCVRNGNYVIELLGFDQYTLTQCIMNLCILLIAMHLTAFLILKYNKIKYIKITFDDANANTKEADMQVMIALNENNTNDNDTNDKVESTNDEEEP